MAIRLKNLETAAKQFSEQRYLYKDLTLDIGENNLEVPGYTLPVPESDLKASFDLGAIRNSLQNLFNTLPGQRFLFPDYGLDLYQFLFLPITPQTGQAIGERMLRAIERYETRIFVRQIQVVARPDANTYLITIVIEIPVFKQETSLQGELNIKTQSFIFVPNSRTL
jgi:phage baseplate assembly protein W